MPQTDEFSWQFKFSSGDWSCALLQIPTFRSFRPRRNPHCIHCCCTSGTWISHLLTLLVQVTDKFCALFVLHTTPHLSLFLFMPIVHQVSRSDAWFVHVLSTLSVILSYKRNDYNILLFCVNIFRYIFAVIFYSYNSYNYTPITAIKDTAYMVTIV